MSSECVRRSALLSDAERGSRAGSVNAAGFRVAAHLIRVGGTGTTWMAIVLRAGAPGESGPDRRAGRRGVAANPTPRARKAGEISNAGPDERSQPTGGGVTRRIGFPD